MENLSSPLGYGGRSSDRNPSSPNRVIVCMGVVVVNYQRAGDVRLFDPSTGTLVVSNEHSWKDADGRFCEQSGSIVCLFQYHDELHLYLDGANTTVDSDVTTNMDTYAQERRFRVFRGAELIYDKTYSRKPNTDGNPFWPSDAEDEDILLWVNNIVSSRDRQQTLLESLAVDETLPRNPTNHAGTGVAVASGFEMGTLPPPPADGGR